MVNFYQIEYLATKQVFAIASHMVYKFYFIKDII